MVMDLSEAINFNYAIPVVGVILCALFVFAFGFKSSVQPPSFEFEEKKNKRSKKSKKVNGLLTEPTVLSSKPPATSSKPSPSPKASPLPKPVEKESATPKLKAKKLGASKIKAEPIPTTLIDDDASEPSEWTTAKGRKDKRGRPEFLPEVEVKVTPTEVKVAPPDVKVTPPEVKVCEPDENDSPPEVESALSEVKEKKSKKEKVSPTGSDVSDRKDVTPPLATPAVTPADHAAPEPVQEHDVPEVDFITPCKKAKKGKLPALPAATEVMLEPGVIALDREVPGEPEVTLESEVMPMVVEPEPAVLLDSETELVVEPAIVDEEIVDEAVIQSQPDIMELPQTEEDFLEIPQVEEEASEEELAMSAAPVCEAVCDVEVEAEGGESAGSDDSSQKPAKKKKKKKKKKKQPDALPTPPDTPLLTPLDEVELLLSDLARLSSDIATFRGTLGDTAYRRLDDALTRLLLALDAVTSDDDVTRRARKGAVERVHAACERLERRATEGELAVEETSPECELVPTLERDVTSAERDLISALESESTSSGPSIDLVVDSEGGEKELPSEGGSSEDGPLGASVEPASSSQQSSIAFNEMPAEWTEAKPTKKKKKVRREN